MKPLFILLAVFAISCIVYKITSADFNINLSGTIALSIMLLFTAGGHFAFTKGMVMMIPSFIPLRRELVYATGILEIVFAIALLIPSWRTPAAWLLIFFLILILPSNIYAAINKVDYQKATFNGNGLNYLWFRIPLQILFIWWTYFFAISK
ncbi:hypothetical protein LT679_04875 [Mucilaginibacter roseus]|uniref:DoxX family membrane protein n=1 Tax=Mucilaginibacter roseus TaxID=1528868 RepID=A0ABS8U1G7_9SPHI|nr:hypothetical protein [Mucilaginibacter roseus]MCD8739925.1 hypothetical protein [Mucilaginibacter roseus]